MRAPVILCMLWACTSLWAADVNAKKGLGIDGYDPVSYQLDSGPQKGSKDLTADHEGVTYRFVNAANLATFKADPANYVPSYGGYCAWAMLDGDKVDVDPESYRVTDGRLFLYYKGIWGDTRKKWVEKSETVPEADLITKADQQWETVGK